MLLLENRVFPLATFFADDGIRAKKLYEADVARCGVEVKQYHADNGIFKAAEWEDAILQEKQTTTFSAAGAHHQNALAERSIQTVTNMARSMLLHLDLHWPDEYSQDLWPFALDYATWLWNHTPKKDGPAPIEIFCKTTTSCEYLRRAKVFGCPVYVLDPRMQDGKKIPKWSPRARLGMFLGFSANHSSSVGNILAILHPGI